MKLSYPHIASTLALVVALSGTAYAAGLANNSVGTPQLKKNAVTSVKVKNKSLKPKDVKGVMAGRRVTVSRTLSPSDSFTELLTVPGSGLLSARCSQSGDDAIGINIAWRTNVTVSYTGTQGTEGGQMAPFGHRATAGSLITLPFTASATADLGRVYLLRTAGSRRTFITVDVITKPNSANKCSVTAEVVS